MSHKKIFIIAALILVFVALPLTPQFYSESSSRTSPAPVIASSQSVSVFFLPSLTFQKNIAFAQSTTVTQGPSINSNFFSCVTNPSTCALYIVSYFINAIASLFVALGAWLVRLGLSFNNTIFDSHTVLIGFSISLAIANLGFVLGIIVIALATILQNQTYGVKKILWKLVVMAILINFGLVITRPIVSLADSLTNYFVQSTTGTLGTDYGAFVTTITNAFAPQTFTNPPSTVGQVVSNSAYNLCDAVHSLIGSEDPKAVADWTGFCGSFATSISGGAVPQVDSFWTMVLAMAFSATFLCVEAIALLALAVLLLVRYVSLGIYLVLLPFAWLAWVFPKYSSEFTKWWNNFIKWTFFPPMALFFIYLSLQTAALNINGVSNSYPQQIIAPTSNTAATAPESTLIPILKGISPVQQAADEILLISLMIGGLFAASALSGKAGSVVTGTAKSAVGWVGKKTWNGAKQQGKNVGDRLRTAGARTTAGERTTRLQRIGSQLQGIPGLGGAGRVIAGIGSPEALHEAKAKEIQANIGKFKSLTNDGLIAAANKRTAFSNPTEAAAVGQELARRNLLNDPRINGATSNRFVQTMGQMGNLKDAAKSLTDEQVFSAIDSGGAFTTSTQASAIGQELVRRNLFGDPRATATRNRLLEAMASDGALKDTVLKPLSQAELIAAANSKSAFTTPEQGAEIGLELARKGWLNNPGLVVGRQQQDFMSMIRRSGKLQDLQNIRPDLVEPKINPATGVMETPIEALTRGVQGIKPGNITEINHTLLGDPTDPALPTQQPTQEQIAAAVALSPQHLGKLGSDGSVQQRNAYLNTMRDTATGWANGSVQLTPEQVNNLQRAMDYTHNSIQWQDIV